MSATMIQQNENPVTPHLPLGEIGARVMLYPMAPQLLAQPELEAIAGAIFGWDLLGDQVYPEIKHWSERFGGKFDAFMKVKLQSWLKGWVKPPEHYVLHAPRIASGQWYRLFRTTMGVPQALRQAEEDRRTMAEEQLVQAYSSLLGPGSRERCDTLQEWWEGTLEVIRMGTWHVTVYSPRWQAFISPFHGFEPGVDPNTMSHADRIRAEFIPPIIQLYPGPFSRENVWNLAEVVRTGAYVEIFGERHEAPPFGVNWGEGVRQSRPGTSYNRTISGIIHRRGTEVQTIPVREAPELDGVIIDAPDPFRLLQDIYAVTGWRPQGVPADALQPGQEERLVRDFKEVICGAGQDKHLVVQRDQFLDAVMVNPNITPVFGRLVSTIPPREEN